MYGMIGIIITKLPPIMCGAAGSVFSMYEYDYL